MNKADITKAFILKHKHITETRRLAKLMFSKYPMLFKDIEAARYYINYCTGKIKKRVNKHTITFAERLQELRAEIQINTHIHSDKTPHKIVEDKALIISDLHIPYVDIETLDMALEYGYNNGVECVIVNGDLLDFGTISRFLSKPNEMRVIEQTHEAINILNYIQKALDCKVVFHAGNHDIRIEHYLMRQAPEFWGVDGNRLHEILKLKQLNIDYVQEYRYMQFGNLNIAHGHHIVKGIFAPVNPARGAFTKTNTSTLISHVHRTSEHIESDMNGKIIGCYSIGCITDIKPDYNPQVSKHNKGFAVVEKDSSGNFEVDNKKIIDNKIK